MSDFCVQVERSWGDMGPQLRQLGKALENGPAMSLIEEMASKAPTKRRPEEARRAGWKDAKSLIVEGLPTP